MCGVFSCCFCLFSFVCEGEEVRCHRGGGVDVRGEREGRSFFFHSRDTPISRMFLNGIFSCRYHWEGVLFIY